MLNCLRECYVGQMDGPVPGQTFGWMVSMRSRLQMYTITYAESSLYRLVSPNS